MTNFQMEITKILVDKALLGAVAMLFGYYLSKRLEMLRTQKTYELFVWEQRADAAKKASLLVTRHCTFLKDFVALVPEIIKDKEATRERRDKLRKQIDELYPHFSIEIQSILPFLPPRLLFAVDEYLTLWTDVKSQIESGSIDPITFPKSDDVTRAASKFAMLVGIVFEGGPHYKPDRDEKKLQQGIPGNRRQSAPQPEC